MKKLISILLVIVFTASSIHSFAWDRHGKEYKYKVKYEGKPHYGYHRVVYHRPCNRGHVVYHRVVYHRAPIHHYYGYRTGYRPYHNYHTAYHHPYYKSHRTYAYGHTNYRKVKIKYEK